MDIVRNLDRTELERQIHAECGVHRDDINMTLSNFFRLVANGVAVKGYVEVHGFGSFRLRELAPRQGTLPDGTTYSVDKRCTVEFNPFEDVRMAVENVTGVECIL